jgi:hypothetical protein
MCNRLFCANLRAIKFAALLPFSVTSIQSFSTNVDCRDKEVEEREREREIKENGVCGYINLMTNDSIELTTPLQRSSAVFFVVGG